MPEVKGSLMANEAESIAITGKAMTAGGSGSAILFGYHAEVIGMVGGLIIGALGLGIQLYYSIKRDRRERRQFEQKK